VWCDCEASRGGASPPWGVLPWEKISWTFFSYFDSVRISEFSTYFLTGRNVVFQSLPAAGRSKFRALFFPSLDNSSNALNIVSFCQITASASVANKISFFIWSVVSFSLAHSHYHHQLYSPGWALASSWGFITIFFYGVGLLASHPTPNLEGQGIPFCLGHQP